jgi:hypothetical protein
MFPANASRPILAARVAFLYALSRSDKISLSPVMLQCMSYPELADELRKSYPAIRVAVR